MAQLPGLDRDASPEASRDRRENASAMRDLGRYSGLGLTLAASLCLFAWGGYALDQRFGTLPLFLILGVLAGAVGGTVYLVRKVQGGPREGGQASRDS